MLTHRRVAVPGAQSAHRIVEDGPELFPGLFLTDGPTAFGPNRLRRGVTRGLVKPSREDLMPRQAASFAGEVGKHGLAHVLRQMGVAGDESQRG